MKTSFLIGSLMLTLLVVGPGARRIWRLVAETADDGGDSAARATVTLKEDGETSPAHA